ncbi:MAG TPA: aminoglycoside phosphotransferase family protein [Gemmatimonadaceae bacterium]|nr:aminoglycoside phosphotransferase family protein [Gemmatimonadaceae bacterium]
MLSENTRRWIEGATGGRVISVAVLPGATSSLLHAVEVETATGRRSLVLRRFVNEKWVKAEPDLAVREGMSLQHATRAGLPAPELVALDADGEHCGVPATLVTRLEGSVVLEPADRKQWLRGLAAAAARINRVDAAGFRWKYRRYNEGVPLAVPLWSKQQGAWAKAIEIVDGPPRSYSECFVHRDYHPSNVLWKNDRVSGVVDWVNGCRGPAGIDVAWCRHNLAELHGVSVADEFLAAYAAEAGSEFQYDPYWDLMSVVELLPGPPSMYEGWRASGVPTISATVLREHVDEYIASVVARL